MVTRKKAATPAVTARRRAKLSTPPGSYFASGAAKENLRFVSTGCALLDEALGGGFVMGRVVNIVADKSAGKTLLAMETMANVLLAYPNAWARYGESESAWDEEYARDGLGLPTDRIILNPKGTRIETVEQLYDDLDKLLNANPDRPGIYVVDSLDAISTEEELDADFNEASYGGGKPKAIGQLFRRLVGRLEEQNVMLVIISQLRDKIGSFVGAETKTRSGGRALDFYATHIVWLRELGKLKRTVSSVERITGLDIEAYVKKNKVGLNYRKARYPLLFGYGVDDMTASVEWLITVGRERLINELGMRKKTERARTRMAAAAKVVDEKPEDAALVPYADFLENVRNAGGQAANDMRAKLAALVRQEWQRIELDTLPRARKYG